MWEQLYDAFWDKLEHFCFRLCRNDERAEDLAQEIFLRALQNRELFESLSPGQAKSWLFAAARNLWCDQVRRSIKEQELLAEFLPGEDALDETAAAALGEAELDTLLARLAPEERTLLVLRYEEGYTAAELEPDTIAKKLTLCDCVEVSCTRLQQNAVNAVARDVVHIALTDAPHEEDEEDAGTVRVNATEYVL